MTNARPGVTNSLDFDILLSDFGLSVIQDANSRQFASLRAGLLRAPEQLAPDKYGILDKKERPTAESDIFTFAALCYEVRLHIYLSVSMLIDHISPAVYHQTAVRHPGIQPPSHWNCHHRPRAPWPGNCRRDGQAGDSSSCPWSLVGNHREVLEGTWKSAYIGLDRRKIEGYAATSFGTSEANVDRMLRQIDIRSYWWYNNLSHDNIRVVRLL